jgi:hypothetical protein
MSVLNTDNRGGKNRAASCCSDRLCARLTRTGRACLDLAGQRARPAFLLVRPCSPVRRRSAPGYRHRRARGFGRVGACRGSRVVRGHRPRWRQDDFDPDAVWIHHDARPPRFDRREPRRASRRGIGGRDGRPEWRRRSRRPVRLLRRPHDERSAGLRRPVDVPPAACRCAGGDGGAGARSGGGSRAGGNDRFARRRKGRSARRAADCGDGACGARRRLRGAARASSRRSGICECS